MRTKLRSVFIPLLCVFVGVGIGVAATYYWVVRPYQAELKRTRAELYIQLATEQVHTVRQIRVKGTYRLVEHIEEQLPWYATNIDMYKDAHPGATKALRLIKLYYQENSMPIPTYIQPTLSSVP